MSAEQISKAQPATETRFETIPTREEVLVVFKRLLNGAEFLEGRTRADEKGLYLWEVKVKKEGGEDEYSYMRKGRYPEGEAKRTAIHVTYYDTDGMPTGGESVALFENGEWEIL